MIVVDTSVWIDQLRGRATPATEKLIDPAVAANILVGDIILLELLQGARSATHASALENMLRQFSMVDMLGDHIAKLAAQHFRSLRALGITIRKTPDLIIATYCIAHGHALLHADRDFDPLVRHLGLRVL